jgi:hypothetical protein
MSTTRATAPTDWLCAARFVVGWNFLPRLGGSLRRRRDSAPAVALPARPTPSAPNTTQSAAPPLGACDVAESCTGGSAAQCPLRLVSAPTARHVPARRQGPCDVAENCTGLRRRLSRRTRCSALGRGLPRPGWGCATSPRPAPARATSARTTPSSTMGVVCRSRRRPLRRTRDLQQVASPNCPVDQLRPMGFVVPHRPAEVVRHGRGRALEQPAPPAQPTSRAACRGDYCECMDGLHGEAGMNGTGCMSARPSAARAAASTASAATPAAAAPATPATSPARIGTCTNSSFHHRSAVPAREAVTRQRLCTGSSPACPVRQRLPLAGSFVCRAAAGLCDVAETCDGVATAACPARRASRVAASPAAQRPAGCDVAETCTGVSPRPARHDTLVSSGTLMPCVEVDVCDLAETCDGVSLGHLPGPRPSLHAATVCPLPRVVAVTSSRPARGVGAACPG